MKTIVCFGDSNTYGWNPDGYRNAYEDRWPNVLGAELGDEVRIIEEGLGGRVFAHDHPTYPGRNGLTYLFPCLQSHQPIDVICIMLGTNDVNAVYGADAEKIKKEACDVLRLILNPEIYDTHVCPQVVLMSPPSMNEDCHTDFYMGGFGPRAAQLIRELSAALRDAAGEFGVTFFDASAVVKGSLTDGIHLMKEDHHTLGKALTPVIRGLLDK